MTLKHLVKSAGGQCPVPGQYEARNSAAVKLVTKASQWRKIGRRKGGVVGSGEPAHCTTRRQFRAPDSCSISVNPLKSRFISLDRDSCGEADSRVSGGLMLQVNACYKQAYIAYVVQNAGWCSLLTIVRAKGVQQPNESTFCAPSTRLPPTSVWARCLWAMTRPSANRLWPNMISKESSSLSFDISTKESHTRHPSRRLSSKHSYSL
ncbi:hypothetical protein EVAR_47316_1 [Eumeta japonica]|uniref:Uncharacterized protein n=1 Tax=Eumeta variegata TaxID=151549 RepID=A0A4C1YKW2_EUMVA|nr:hypothetical protein EVAR_47316_1 [Eumeta japonica]